MYNLKFELQFREQSELHEEKKKKCNEFKNFFPNNRWKIVYDNSCLVVGNIIDVSYIPHSQLDLYVHDPECGIILYVSTTEIIIKNQNNESIDIFKIPRFPTSIKVLTVFPIDTVNDDSYDLSYVIDDDSDEDDVTNKDLNYIVDGHIHNNIKEHFKIDDCGKNEECSEIDDCVKSNKHSRDNDEIIENTDYLKSDGTCDNGNKCCRNIDNNISIPTEFDNDESENSDTTCAISENSSFYELSESD